MSMTPRVAIDFWLRRRGARGARRARMFKNVGLPPILFISHAEPLA
jgi:hypothetical protein